MNKKNIAIIIIVLIILAGLFYFFDFKNDKKDSHNCKISKEFWCELENKCLPNGEICELKQTELEKLLDKAVNTIGMNLTLMNQVIKFNSEKEHLAFNAKGYYFSDLQNAEKIIKGFEDLENLLKENNFAENNLNKTIETESKIQKMFLKEGLACELAKSDNPNQTSSVSIFCADLKDRVYDISSDIGKDCISDSECVVITDGCKRELVCKSNKYKYFNNCLNPTAEVDAIKNANLGGCLCQNNKCVGKPKSDIE